MTSGQRANSFAARIVAWQRTHGRHDLPWQNTRDAYRIWLSEIMLQQTQVTTVLPYYERFLQRFPDVLSLAAASEDDVLALWAGLGYYSRARNLHRAAQQVVTQHGGCFPADVDALAALPGVGRSTAAAIAAFAYDVVAPILDGNVKRVLARHAAVDGFPGASTVEKKLWQIASERLPAQSADIVAYAQGLMDLGATVCTRGDPRCGSCPVAADCVAREQGRTAELPTARPAKALPERRQRYLLLRHSDDVLLVKRPAPGIWGGLWCLPEIGDDESALPALLRERFGVNRIGDTRQLPDIVHTFTHFRLTLVITEVAVAGRAPVARDSGTVWLALAEASGAALPKPISRLLISMSDAKRIA